MSPWKYVAGGGGDGGGDGGGGTGGGDGSGEAGGGDGGMSSQSTSPNSWSNGLALHDCPST